MSVLGVCGGVCASAAIASSTNNAERVRFMALEATIPQRIGGRPILAWGPLWGRLSGGQAGSKAGCGHDCPPYGYHFSFTGYGSRSGSLGLDFSRALSN